MQSLLVILYLAAPFDFAKKPEVQPEPIVVKAIGNDDVIAKLRDKNDALQSHNEELQTKLAKLESQLQAQTTYAQEQYDRASELANIDPIQITNLAAIKEVRRRVQVKIVTSPACSHCGPFVARCVAQLVQKPKGYTVSSDPNAEFYVETISKEEWAKRTYDLPRVELRVDDKVVVTNERNPLNLAKLYNAEISKLPQENSEQQYGATVATIEGKQQVIQMLDLLEPFLDGGTLQLIYTSRPGVVNKFLTIKKGAAGIKIPPKTSFTLQMVKGDLTVTFQDPKPELIIGPIERGVQEVNITPNKISVRLPWMIDPELQLK